MCFLMSTKVLSFAYFVNRSNRYIIEWYCHSVSLGLFIFQWVITWHFGNIVSGTF